MDSLRFGLLWYRHLRGVILKFSCLILAMVSLHADTGTINPKDTLSGSNRKDETFEMSENEPGKTRSWFDVDQSQIEHQDWMFHIQNTDIVQGHPRFHSPYAGQNSLTAGDTLRQTVSLDLYLGAHLWPGGELYFNPQYYQGFGFNQTRGIAAFPNGEAYKVGTVSGNEQIAHLFYRQTFGFDGEQEQLFSDELQLAHKVDIARLTLTIGKVGVGDQFDCNAYAHNQRTQFMNWALIDGGAFDYAADALGGTYGITLEFNQKDWALRWGGFMVPRGSNGLAWDHHPTKGWQDVLEFEKRYSISEHPGKVRLLGWLENAKMGTYGGTLSHPELLGDITQTRKYRLQGGFILNIEQEITSDLGAFLRTSWRDGKTEVWQFTDIDRSLSLGVQLKGTKWNRPMDVVGIAGIVNELSPIHRSFLAAGGIGPLIGDGQLNYSQERVVESYYDAQIVKYIHVAFDYQFVDNPAYNTDRGPVHIFSARLHMEF